MTDDVLNNPGGLVKFVVPYCNSEGEYLGQVTEDDNEYDPYYRVYNRKYVLKFHKIYVQQYIFGLRGYNTQWLPEFWLSFTRQFKWLAPSSRTAVKLISTVLLGKAVFVVVVVVVSQWC